MVRNVTLDFFGFLLIILFITAHLQPLLGENDVTGWLISNGIARITLPFLFIINGYYLLPKLINSHRIKRYILHLVVVYMVWTLIYLPIYIQKIDILSFISILILGYYHLWFLSALIIGLLILWGIKRVIKNNKIILVIAIIIYVIGYIILSLEYDYRIVQNGLFIGFPFITIGYFIRKNDIINKAENTPLIIIFTLSIITLLLESYTGFKFSLYRDIYLSLLFSCSTLFILIMKHSFYTLNKKYLGELSAGVYLVHIFIIFYLVPNGDINYIYKYPFVILGSIILSMTIVFINRYVKVFL